MAILGYMGSKLQGTLKSSTFSTLKHVYLTRIMQADIVNLILLSYIDVIESENFSGEYLPSC